MWLDSVATTGVTAVSLIVLLYFSQLRGWIYFKPQVDEIRKATEDRIAEVRADRDARVAEAREDRDARIADKEKETTNLWEALSISERGRLTAVEQNQRLLEGVETTVQVVQAIPSPQAAPAEGEGT